MSPLLSSCLEQTAILQIILDYHVRDCVKHKLKISRMYFWCPRTRRLIYLDIGCVSRAGEMGVDLLEVALGVPAPGKYKEIL